jgi:hypothetical protein
MLKVKTLPLIFVLCLCLLFSGCGGVLGVTKNSSNVSKNIASPKSSSQSANSSLSDTNIRSSAPQLNTSNYNPPKVISLIPIEQAMGSGVVKTNYSDVTTYNTNKLDNFIKNTDNHKPDTVTIISYSTDFTIAENYIATDMYYLTFDGNSAYCYKYLKLNNLEYSYSTAMRFKNIVKTVTKDITSYKMFYYDSDNIDEIFIAQNDIEPQTPLKCAELYVKALKERDGITQYYLSTQSQRKLILENFYGWTTGVSSPHIDSYSVSSGINKNGEYNFNAKIVWAAGGEYATDHNTLTIIKINNQFKVSDMK